MRAIRHILTVVLVALLLVQPVTQAFSQEAGTVYQDPQGRFTWPLGGGNWQPAETDGSYAQFTLDVPQADAYIVTPVTDDVDAAARDALTTIGVDTSALPSPDILALGPWQAYIYSLPDGQNITMAAQPIDGGTLVIALMGEEGVITGLRDTVGVDKIVFASTAATLPASVEGFEAYASEIVTNDVPGMSIVVTLGGDVLYANGFGMADGPQGYTATPDTVYMWGSMTKMVTATAVMQLFDQGLIDLDAPVSDYLNYFPDDTITVRQLLNHSAGLPEAPGDTLRYANLDGNPLANPTQVARAYVEQFPGTSFEPGANAAYSNSHYLMLGEIVVAVSGQPYTEYVRENILAPLGMNSTDFLYSSDAMIANAAAQSLTAGNVDRFITQLDEARGLGDGADFVREIDDQYAWLNRFTVFSAYGGLIGSASDLARFAQMHLNRGELEGVRILSPEAAALMQETQLSSSGDPLPWGLAWFKSADGEHPYVEHTGSVKVGLNNVRIYPNEGLAIIVMGNGSGYDVETVTNAAANVVFTLLTAQ